MMARSHHETEEVLSSPTEKTHFYDETHLTLEGFLKACRDSPEALYKAFSKHIEILEEANREGKAEIANLQKEIKAFEQELDLQANENMGVQELTEELAVKDNRILDLVMERDTLRKAISCMDPKATMSSTRSIKLPDPPILTDGKDPAFDNWLLKMEGKLEANKDHFGTEAIRMAYIDSRTGGNAAKHLGPRLRTTAPDRFTTGREIYYIVG